MNNNGVTFEWDDVVNVIRNIRGYLAVIAIVLIFALVVTIVVKRVREKTVRSFIRKQTWMATSLAVVLIVNFILIGPMKAIINAATADVKTLSEKTASKSRDLITEIAEEGIVLAKNDDNMLPLTQKSLNVFGWSSVTPIYGGGGAGSIDASGSVTLLDGLSQAGFSVNKELVDFYNSYDTEGRGRVGSPAQEWTLPEPPIATYSQEMIDNAKEFSDTAVIVLGRSGGEGADLPTDMGAVIDGSWNTGIYYKNASFVGNSDEYNEFEDGESYLELSHTEKDMINLVCNNFNNVVVIYNGANTLELGWVENYKQIKSVLLVPGAGVTGFVGLGEILAGTINPSGKTVDTWVSDVCKIPAINNYGEFSYDSRLELVDYLTEKNGEARIQGVGSFVNYNEGIYVGYRYYETAAAEAKLKEGNMDEVLETDDIFDYDKEVVYPFGYGLSYTSFSQSMVSMNEEDGKVKVDVRVTNTGDVAGKDVVQIYYNPPYENGGIEKASTNLIAFDKTDILQPGDSQTLTLSFNVEEMASYDADGHGCYVLEDGDYIISINSDSHHPIEEKVYTVKQDIIYDESNSRTSDYSVAENKLGFAKGEHEILSRANGFANYERAIAGPPAEQYDRSLEELIPYFDYDETEFNDSTDVMPTLGAKNGIELIDMRGASYDDSNWDKLLDQLTFEDMVDLIQFGGYQTIALDSIGKVATIDVDGAAGLNDSVSGNRGTGFCVPMMLAQTWNLEIAEKLGEAVGQEGYEMGISGWYAPSLNMHRTPFGGRNFEYYSEDAMFSGKMGAAVVDGVRSKGMYSYIKHFAINDQEINRHSIFTWVDEQTIREIYLRPFEYTVKENNEGPLAVMSSYNYLGTTWAGGCAELLNEILRDEWGFRGMVLTDYFNQFYMDADKAIRGGNDLMLSTTGGQNAVITDQSATSVLAMRQASKNILYTVVNSLAYQDYEPNQIQGWMKVLYGVDMTLALAFVGVELYVCKKFFSKKKRHEE